MSASTPKPEQSANFDDLDKKKLEHAESNDGINNQIRFGSVLALVYTSANYVINSLIKNEGMETFLFLVSSIIISAAQPFAWMYYLKIFKRFRKRIYGDDDKT